MPEPRLIVTIMLIIRIVRGLPDTIFPVLARYPADPSGAAPFFLILLFSGLGSQVSHAGMKNNDSNKA
jgi:hypothetical protein